MAYKVKLTAPAEADAYAAYEYIREFSPRSAEKWLRELFQALLTLDEMPSRCPVIAEAEENRTASQASTLRKANRNLSDPL